MKDFLLEAQKSIEDFEIPISGLEMSEQSTFWKEMYRNAFVRAELHDADYKTMVNVCITYKNILGWINATYELYKQSRINEIDFIRMTSEFTVAGLDECDRLLFS